MWFLGWFVLVKYNFIPNHIGKTPKPTSSKIIGKLLASTVSGRQPEEKRHKMVDWKKIGFKMHGVESDVHVNQPKL